MNKHFGYAVRLFKKNGIAPFQFPDADSHPESLCLYGYGYYDAVEILPLTSLLYETWNQGDLPVGNDPVGCLHQDILFQRIAAGDDEIDLSKYSFACVSFLQLDEDGYNGSAVLSDIVECLKEIEVPGGVRAEYFYTLGSSALGLLLLPDLTGAIQPEVTNNLFMNALTYLDNLRALGNSVLQKNGKQIVRLLDTYSILGYNHRLLESSQEYLCNNYPQILPSVSFNMHTRVGAHVRILAEQLSLDLLNDAQLHDHSLIQTMGNEDFVLHLYNVPLGKLLAISHPFGVRAEQPSPNSPHTNHYLDYCHDIATTVGIPPTAIGTDTRKDSISSFDRAEWQKDVLALEELGFLDLAHALRALATYLERLSGSCFTSWIWTTHKDALSRFRQTLISSARQDTTVVSRVEKHFHFILSALDCLAFTSSYSSENPGYHKLQDDFCSRLIVSYNRQLNAITRSWDEFNNLCKAKPIMRELLGATPLVLEHAVFCGINTMQSRVSMEIFDNPANPGDVIFVQFPTLLAYQPFFTLPAMCHELGHAIGPRHRQVRKKFYANILADYLCNRTLAHILHIHEDISTPAGDQNILVRKIDPVNRIVVMALYTWREVFAKYILESVEKEFERRCTEKAKASCHCASCAWLSKDLREMMYRALCQLLVTEENWAARIAEDYRIHGGGSLENANNLYAALRKGLSGVCVELLYSSKNYFLFVEERLAEPLSDYFMIELCGCSGVQYLQICFWLLRASLRCDKLTKEKNQHEQLQQLIQETILDSRHLTRFLTILDVVYGLKSGQEIREMAFGVASIFAKKPELDEQYKLFVDVLAAQQDIYCADEKNEPQIASALRTYRMHYSMDVVHDYLENVMRDPRMDEKSYSDISSDIRSAEMDKAQQKFINEKEKMQNLFQAAWSIVEKANQQSKEHDFFDLFFGQKKQPS